MGRWVGGRAGVVGERVYECVGVREDDRREGVGRFGRRSGRVWAEGRQLRCEA